MLSRSLRGLCEAPGGPRSTSKTLEALVGSVSNGSGPSLRVWVRVQTEPLPNWRSGSSINPKCLLGYGYMVNS